MKFNNIFCIAALSTLVACGGGTGTEGFTGATSPKLELFIQNRTLEPNYSPSSQNSTYITARLKHQQSGRLLFDQTPGVNWAYSTKDDVNVYFICLDGDDEPCKKKVQLLSYTSKKMVDGYDRILFVNAGSTSGQVEIVATIQDPFNKGNTIASRRGAPISISGGSSSAYSVGARISGSPDNNYLKPANINPMVAYVIDEGGSKPKGNGNNNIVVRIVDAPDGTTISGNTFVRGNSIYQEGEQLYLSSDFNGEAVFFLQTPNLSGDVKLKIESDRSDNNVDDGIQEPVTGYAYFKIADSQNTDKISFSSKKLQYTLIVDEEYKEEKIITIPVFGDFAKNCALVNGNLPLGMNFGHLNTQFCYLSGKPQMVGTYESTIAVASNRPNEVAYADMIIDVVGKDDFVILPGSNLGTKLLNDYFSVQIKVSSDSGSSKDAKDPSSVKLIDGKLPESLSLTGNLISGKLTEVGSFTFTLEVRDSVSNRVKTKQFYLRVIDGAIVLVDGPSAGSGSSTKTLPAGEVDSVYNPHVIKAEGFNKYVPVPPFTWTLASGSLPDGLTIDLTATGDSVILSGTPTKVGVFIFVLSVKDANGVIGKQTYKITISEKPDPCKFSPKPPSCP